MTFLFELHILLHTGSGRYAVYQDGTNIFCKQLSFKYKFNDRYSDFEIEKGRTDYKHAVLAEKIIEFKYMWDSAGEAEREKARQQFKTKI